MLLGLLPAQPRQIPEPRTVPCPHRSHFPAGAHHSPSLSLFYCKALPPTYALPRTWVMLAFLPVAWSVVFWSLASSTELTTVVILGTDHGNPCFPCCVVRTANIWRATSRLLGTFSLSPSLGHVPQDCLWVDSQDRSCWHRCRRLALCWRKPAQVQVKPQCATCLRLARVPVTLHSCRLGTTSHLTACQPW